MATSPAAGGMSTAGGGDDGKKIEPNALEAKVWSIMAKWERTEMERSGGH
jgi:hypothetical protein